jgi:hypothetical protein
MSDEIKVVITLKEGGASVGIQKPDCDPIFSKVEGELPAVLKAIPKLIAGAKTSWEANSKYPECKTDLKPKTPPPQTRVTTQPRQPKTEQPALL